MIIFTVAFFPNLKRHGNGLLVLPKLNLCFCVDSIWLALGYVTFSLACVNEAVETGVDANWGILQGGNANLNGNLNITVE